MGSSDPRIGCVVGSLSSASINRRLAAALPHLYPSMGFEPVDIAELPLYSPDVDGAFPVAATAFKSHLRELDAILFVTPEYNRSISGALKNALDWGSRPWGDNSWSGLPAAMLGAGLNRAGTAVAQAHLRGVLGYLAMHLLAVPETCVAWTEGVLDDPVTQTALTTFLAAFDAQVRPLTAARLALHSTSPG